MQTAYCREGHRLQVIVEVHPARPNPYSSGIHVHAKLACGDEANIVMSKKNIDDV